MYVSQCVGLCKICTWWAEHSPPICWGFAGCLTLWGGVTCGLCYWWRGWQSADNKLLWRHCNIVGQILHISGTCFAKRSTGFILRDCSCWTCHSPRTKKQRVFFLGMTTCHQWICDSAPMDCFESSYDARCSFHSSLDSGNTQGLCKFKCRFILSTSFGLLDYTQLFHLCVTEIAGFASDLLVQKHGSHCHAVPFVKAFPLWCLSRPVGWDL